MQSNDLSGKSRWLPVVIIGFIVVLASVVRVYLLHLENIWYDEWVTARQINQPTLKSFLVGIWRKDPVMQPAYFTALYIWTRLFSESELSMRMMSVAVSTAGIGLITAAAYRSAGIFAALTTGLALTFADYHVQLSQEIRTYPFVFFLVSVSMFSGLEAIRGGKYENRWWLAQLAAHTVLLATHYFAAFYLVCAGLWLLIWRYRNPRFLILWGLGHIPGLLLTLYSISKINTHVLDKAAAWIVTPPIIDIVLIALRMYFGASGAGFRAWYGLAFFPFALVTALGCGLLVNWIGRAIQQGRISWDTDWLKPFTLALLVAVVPTILLLIFSYTVRPAAVLRYTMYSTIATLFLSGLIVARVPFPKVRPFIVAILVAYLAVDHFSNGRPRRIPLRAAAEMITESGDQRQEVVIIPEFHVFPLRYYLKPGYVSAVGVHTMNELYEQVDESFDNGHDAVWVLWNGPRLTDFPYLGNVFETRGYRVESDFEHDSIISPLNGIKLVRRETGPDAPDSE